MPEPATPNVAQTPQIAALDLEVEVRQVLEASFGWVPLDTIRFALPQQHRNEQALERLLFQLAERGVIRLNARAGRSLLVYLPREGQEPTAEVLPDPAPKVVKYVAAAGDTDAIPTVRRRFRPAPPIASTQESQMSDETAATILKIVREGPVRIGALGKRAKVSGATCRYHLVRLAEEGKVEQADPSNRMSAWRIPGTKTAAAPETTQRNGHRREIEDLTLKLQTLDAQATAAKAAGHPISAFILAEIRADLERLAA